MDVERLYSRINLTPLLDVIFILLFLYLGNVAQREEETKAHYQTDKSAERQLRVLLEAQKDRNKQLLAELRARSAGRHRTLAAERVLDHNFEVYELWLDPDHWMRLKTPQQKELRRRVNTEQVRSLLGGAFSQLADPRRTVVLFFKHPRSIWEDVRIIRAELKKGGWINQEYTLPAEKK